MRMWSITTWLIVINVAVYFANNLTGGRLENWGYFSAETAIHGLQLWRFLTFQFLHASLSHILFNMIALYFFGPLVETYLGARRYLAFYLLCGMAGAALYLIFWRVGVLDVLAETRLVGASAGIFGVLIGAARVAPDTTVMLLFPPIPMKLKVFAWVMLAIALATVLEQGQNAGGQVAHLGGAGVGALLIHQPRLLEIFTGWPGRRRKRRFFMDDWR